MIDNYFSIIIPVYKEAKNIPELIERIACVNKEISHFEVIIVDDNSQDGTDEVVNGFCMQYPWLRLIVRFEKKGLSQSVVAGLAHAKYPNCIIMDADLSHPPEKIPQMLSALSKENVDLVIGSRYIEGASHDESWPVMRQWLSLFAAMLARIVIARPLKDPLSGFLAFRKKTYALGDRIEALGWKIGLEIIVKCRCKNVIEVPIHFSRRTQGESKLNLRVVWDYLRQISHLLRYKIFSKLY